MKKLSRQLQLAVIFTVMAVLILLIFALPFVAFYCITTQLWSSAIACLIMEVACIFTLITLIED